MLQQSENFGKRSNCQKSETLNKRLMYCKFLQGSKMQGIVVGGNIRCLLKLAGTEYWPDMNGKILLLESFIIISDSKMILFFEKHKKYRVF